MLFILPAVTSCTNASTLSLSLSLFTDQLFYI